MFSGNDFSAAPWAAFKKKSVVGFAGIAQFVESLTCVRVAVGGRPLTDPKSDGDVLTPETVFVLTPQMLARGDR